MMFIKIRKNTFSIMIYDINYYLATKQVFFHFFFGTDC